MKKLLIAIAAVMAITAANAQTGNELPFQKWALTPPMGWNSWDCYGPTVVESEVKANADYMAAKLSDYGWEYVVVDIRWFVENDKAGGYNQTNPIYVYDEYGRYTPALNRFPSAADGAGFRPLADYVHSKGLKFGIHIMRGLPKEAAAKKLPVKGTNGITCDMIASNDSACTWLRDNYKVDWRKPGAQEYYNSIFDLYAEWGVDFIKIDDLSRPYHTAEIEMIRNAIDNCGRPIVLSISPGETPIEKVDHVLTHANMWRTVDDFWDNWSQLNYQFGICAKWAPYIAPGTWADADMLPLGKISIRGERGSERFTNFTRDEQYTMMNLWTIFKSPLMFGGDMPQNDAATDSLLTNRNVLYMHSYSAANRQVSNDGTSIIWSADDPANGDKFVALFNTGGSSFVNTADALYRSGTISYLTTGYATDVDVTIPTGSRQLALIVTDGGDGYDSDHADWINPVVTLADGSTVDLTTAKYLRGTCGWGNIHVNRNLNGGQLSIDGNKYDKGYAVHANSILLFDLPEGATKFTALAGIDNTGSDQGSKSSVEFMVFNYDPTLREESTDRWNGGDVTIKIDPAKQVACSGLISRESAEKEVELQADITGASKLYLVVTNGGDGLTNDHADWINPVLISANGTETSLTSIAWDANPVNGWNAPQINKNNSGNTLRLGNTDYTTGFGVNAPSMLVFTLPEGHDFNTFKVLTGYDADVALASEGVSMEFRVFTSDPTPDNSATVALDLTKLGFAPDQTVSITEMWSGNSIGKFKNSEFAPTLREHASGLYRIAADNRRSGAKAVISVEPGEHNSDIPFDITITVTGGDSENAYVQLLCDNKIIGTLQLDNSGTAVYSCSGLYDGSHTLTAKYSGTTSIAPAISEPVTINIKGAPEDLSFLRRRLSNLINEAQAIDQASIAGATRKPLADAIAGVTDIDTMDKNALEESISMIQSALDNARKSMSYMSRLNELMTEASEFASKIVTSDDKSDLLALIEDCRKIAASDESTIEDIEDARARLQSLFDQVKKSAEPVPGENLDMTGFIVNPSFEDDINGWLTNDRASGWSSFATWSDRPADDGISFVSLCHGDIISLDLYQVIRGLPNGTYSLEAALRNTDGTHCLTDQHVYAETGGTEYSSARLSNVSGDNNNDWYHFTVSDIQLLAGEPMRIGVRSTGTGSGTAGWFQADNFRLYYWGRSGVENVAYDNVGLLVINLVDGGIEVISTQEQQFAVYNVTGAVVSLTQLHPGSNTIALPAGQYVTRGRAFIVK